MNKSKIEWTDRTWNPVTGCTKVSQGCKNCYAERLYERFNGPHSFKNVLTHSERLSQPQKWKQPSKIFVNSMSDLFHEDVPFDFIHDVFDVMASCKQHIFQVLTKRPERMLEFMKQFDGKLISENIWIGVSVEDQVTADERIPLLLSVPVKVRFLSCEPLLGKIYFTKVVEQEFKPDTFIENLKGIHWVICGGESGPKARPMHPDWPRMIRDQCKAAEVPFFFKQWGEWAHTYNAMSQWDEGTGLMPDRRSFVFEGKEHKHIMTKEGKKAAGNLLDGRAHLDFPTEKTISK